MTPLTDILFNGLVGKNFYTYIYHVHVGLALVLDLFSCNK